LPLVPPFEQTCKRDLFPPPSGSIPQIEPQYKRTGSRCLSSMNMARTFGRRRNKPARLSSTVFAVLLAAIALTGNAFGAEAAENCGPQKPDPPLEKLLASRDRQRRAHAE